MIKRLLLVAIALLCSTCMSNDVPHAHYISFDAPAELQEYLRWSPGRTPLLAAHRGGPSPGFPENCIATFERSLSFAPCLIECDVRKSQDGVLILMHDWDLERTSTGEGPVDSMTLAQLDKLKLYDADQTLTEHKIPTLSEALRWAKGRAILELDIKAPVTPQEVVQAIRAEGAESHTVVIAYSLETAELYHSLDGDLVMSCSARGIEGVTRLLESGIPAANLIAYTGVYEPSTEVYSLLHERGICAILGTMGNLDRKAKRRGVQVYTELLRNGADILATDQVEMASKALTPSPHSPVKSR